MIQERAYFKEIEGKRIFCVRTRPAKKSRGCVILVHGFRSSADGSARRFIILSRRLAQIGIASVRFDQYGSGHSEGDFYNSSFSDWVRTIIYFINHYTEKNHKLGLVGVSMGATALVKAMENKKIRDRIAGLALLVPDPKIDRMMIRGEFMEEGGQRVNKKFWAETEECNFLSNLASFTRKCLIFYGEKDKHVPPKTLNQLLSEIKKQQKQLVVLKGEDHDGWTYETGSRVVNDLVNFFDKIF